MRYLHTMVRISDIDQSLQFYCDILGLSELYRYDSEAGRFTNIFLAAPEDLTAAQETRAPVIELTYNWPNEDGEVESYGRGRNFGHLAFSVENVYELCHTMRMAGVTINRPPRDGKMAFVTSPDGISIELLQAGDALPLQEPWRSMENTGTW